jgi:ankyrin repeat protein
MSKIIIPSIPIEELRCPIFHTIMLNPVIAGDGIFYEEDAIDMWFKSNSTSPVTGQKIKKSFTPSINLKNIINFILQVHPELKDEQYLKTPKPHMENYTYVTKIIAEEKYSKLLEYNEFHLNEINQGLFKSILINATDNVIIHIIDNISNLGKRSSYNNKLISWIVEFCSLPVIKYSMLKSVELNFTEENKRKNLIHLACKRNNEIAEYFIDLGENLGSQDEYGERAIHLLLKNKGISNDTIIRLVEKKICLDCPNKLGQYPINLVCQFRDDELLKYFMGLKLDFEKQSKKKYRPIHFLITNSKINNESIIDFIETGVDIEACTATGKTPLLLACNYSERQSVVSHLLKKNVNLECADGDGWRPIHYICNGVYVNKSLSSKDMALLIELVDKGIDLNCETKDGQRPIHLLAEPSKLSALQYLLSKGTVITDFINDNGDNNNNNNNNNSLHGSEESDGSYGEPDDPNNPNGPGDSDDSEDDSEYDSEDDSDDRNSHSR